MFTGMAVRMVQELGLHRDRPPTETSSNLTQQTSSPNLVTLEAFETSAQIVLFWSVYALDTCLANGVGRVPSVKRHEISVRYPEDNDFAILRAGPRGKAQSIRAEVYPHMVRMVQCYSDSIEFLNTSSSQTQPDPTSNFEPRTQRLEQIKNNMISEFKGAKPGHTSFCISSTTCNWLS